MVKADILETRHVPVLLKETIDSLSLKSGDIVFDGTLGGGGYSEEILKIIGDTGVLVATDLDLNAIARSKKRLEKYKSKKYFINSNYAEIEKVLSGLKISGLNKIVLDLGISSDQLDNSGRGISFKNLEEPLDMSLSISGSSLSAAEILNTWSAESMADIFFYYGGEKASRYIAEKIVEERTINEFKKVGDLVEFLEKHLSKFYKKKKIHPATKIFQALRITVNDEISNLKFAIKDMVSSLSSGGIISIVSFHSLEDKAVKNIFRFFEDEGVGERLNKKVIVPDEEELKKNLRSRSAKLRIFKKK